MRKRLAIITVTAMSALGLASGASAAMWNFPPQPHHNAPSGAGCAGADLTCKA
jgi:hypothetical protein